MQEEILKPKFEGLDENVISYIEFMGNSIFNDRNSQLFAAQALRGCRLVEASPGRTLHEVKVVKEMTNVSGKKIFVVISIWYFLIFHF